MSRAWRFLPFLLVALVLGPLAPPAHAAVLAPTAVTASRGTGDQVSVLWSVPSGQSASSYVARAFTTSTGTATWDECSGASGASTTCEPGDVLTVPRVSDAWVSVSATDGTSTETSAPRVQVPAMPAAPSAPVVTSLSTSLRVAWTWAAEGAGVTPTSYTASAYSAASGGTAVSSCTAATSPCTISGLIDGSTYYVDVVASAGVGDSAPSARVAGEPTAEPSAPTSVDVLGGDTVLTVTWAAPVNTGASAITAYLVEAYNAASGGSVISSCQPATLTAFRCNLEGLTNGVSAFVQVRATNASGTGPASTRIEAHPGGRPTAPRSVLVERGDGTMNVTWSAPVSDGGSPITGYTANAFETSTSATVLASCTTTTGTSCTISGITNTVTYSVSVVATTLVGSSQPSSRTLSRPSSAPTPPRSVVAIRGDGFATVSWTAPESSNGSTITKYVARAYREGFAGTAIAECSPIDRQLRCNLGPLPNGTTYYVDVVAVTAKFVSEPSTPRVAVLTGAHPAAPRDVTVVQQGRDLVVRWRVPVADGGQPITKYTATAFAGSTGTTARGTCATAGDSCTITALAGAPVHVSVTATSSVGTSAPSSPRVKVTIKGAPSEPRQVSAHRDGRQVLISWLRSADDGGSAITGYRVQLRDAGGRVVGSCTAQTPRGPINTRVACAVRPASTLAVSVVVDAVNANASTPAAAVGVSALRLSPPRSLVVLPAENALVATVARSSVDERGARYIFRAWSQERGGTLRASCTSALDEAQPTCTLTELANYAPVWVDAVARTGAFASRPTPRQRVVPMASPPSLPRDVTASWVGEGLVVRWQQPSSDGGYAISSTTVRVSDVATGGTSLGTCVARGTETTCTVRGLSVDYVYVTVQAVNPVGAGPVTIPLGRNRDAG